MVLRLYNSLFKQILVIRIGTRHFSAGWTLFVAGETVARRGAAAAICESPLTSLSRPPRVDHELQGLQVLKAVHFGSIRRRDALGKRTEVVEYDRLQPRGAARDGE